METQKVINWATERGIFEKANPLSQVWKTIEEVEELEDAILDNNTKEIKDAIGDIIVTLIIQAEMQGTTIEECYELAYNEIKDRTGKMVDGTFVKD